jgi:hypothetical protein
MQLWGEGIHDIPEEEYHWRPTREPCLSSSVAKSLLYQSPGHVFAEHPGLNPKVQKEVGDESKFAFGRAYHDYILEGGKKIYIVEAENYRTKLARELRDLAINAGEIPLLSHQHDQLLAMAEVMTKFLKGFKEFNLFENGKPEQALIWKEGDVWCKARLDWLHNEYKTIDDLKTTLVSGNPDTFRRQLFSLHYDIQAAFYQRGVKALTGKTPGFRFVVQEAQKPYAVSCLSLDLYAQELAEMQVSLAIKKWRHCLSSKQWDFYPKKTCYIAPPAWLEAQVQEMEMDLEIVEKEGKP